MMNRGLSMVEMLVALALVAVLAMVVTGAINPKAITDRGGDAKRKSDLAKIKTAFESYFTDKGCYPMMVAIVSLRCGSGDFSPWLQPWPCDADDPYQFAVEDNSNCPRWFKVFANLRNRQDKDIPSDWYAEAREVGSELVSYGNEEVNFGTSSDNVVWSE